MKLRKVAGILFIVVGISFVILGLIKYIISFTKKEDCVYTTANIVKIDERETGDPEEPIDYTTYVELEVNDEKVTTKLNTYKSSFKVGKKIEVYYFKNDTQMVYEKDSASFFIFFALSGAIFAVLGAIVIFKKRKMRLNGTSRY